MVVVVFASGPGPPLALPQLVFRVAGGASLAVGGSSPGGLGAVLFCLAGLAPGVGLGVLSGVTALADLLELEFRDFTLPGLTLRLGRGLLHLLGLRKKVRDINARTLILLYEIIGLIKSLTLRVYHLKLVDLGGS